MPPVTVLGISCFYHDAAAALVRDGEIVAAAQEERFSRKKHDPRFPRHAINYSLEEAFIEAEELDAVVFYDDPVQSFDRVLKSLCTVAPRGAEQWEKAGPSFLGTKLFVSEHVRRTLRVDVPVLCTRHHLSHAASAFYPSPFERAAILTIDGVGEWATTSLALGEGNAIRTLKEIRYPHSLGLLYSAFTSFCGFKVNSGEYKLMGLAPYGEPRYVDRILDRLIQLRPDGSFRLDMAYFGYLDSNAMTNERFHALFDGPPRAPESRIGRREMDLAASIQRVIEQALLGLARHAREQTGATQLCLAGGVALNCVANGVLLREGIFDDLWIQPAAGDAGGALGAALAASHMHFGVSRSPRPDGRDSLRGSYLGPAYSSAEVRAFLDRHGHSYDVIASPQERADFVAAALAQGKVVGLLSGRMEFGPRALGARSILGDPRNPETQVLMNLKIKYRESFRPFAPAVREARCADYFELDRESPYMLLVAPVRASRRLPVPRLEPGAKGDVDLLEIVRQPRSDVPAITHVDYSARVQTVRREVQPDFDRVLEAFERRTGCPVLVNTSFNVRGEPIVCTPEDAFRCFMRTQMDVLVLEDCVLLKEKQMPLEDDDAWRQEYELD
ncbi:MAG TPA: carbamoyltransferase [Myxococcota bacterium]|nr:carbamoyltransferase [Myxococcota bacterium]